MKKLLCILITGSVLVAASCKRDSDILATYEGGAVTRGEFNAWLQARNIPQELTKKRAKQQELLDRFATERLVAAEARAKGFDKSESYQYALKQAERTFYAASLAKKLNSDEKFREKAARVKIIKLQVRESKVVDNKVVPLGDDEIAAAVAQKEKKAGEILAELKKGTAFEDLAKKYSDDFSKTNGGDIGYIVAGMRGEDFTKAVFALREGEYTVKPIKQKGGIYLVKLEELTELTERNIDDIITDKRMAMGLRRKIIVERIKQLHQQLASAKDVEDNTAQAASGNPATVLYKIGENVFTVGDLNTMIGVIGKKRQSMGYKAMGFDAEARKKEVSRHFREALLAREVVNRGMDKDPRFQKDLAFFRDYNLARAYEEEQVMSDIRVTENDLRKEYEENRDKTYTRIEEKKGKKIKTVVPFATVRESIQFRLLNYKKSEARREWEAALLKSKKYQVNPSELEGGE